MGAGHATTHMTSYIYILQIRSLYKIVRKGGGPKFVYKEIITWCLGNFIWVVFLGLKFQIFFTIIHIIRGFPRGNFPENGFWTHRQDIKYFENQRRPWSRLANVMFHGTPCIYIYILESSDDWFYKSISMYKHLLMYNLPVQPEAVVLKAGGDLLALSGIVQYTHLRIISFLLIFRVKIWQLHRIKFYCMQLHWTDLAMNPFLKL